MITPNPDGTLSLVLHGPFPSKKNRRAGYGNRSHYDKATKLMIERLVLEARAAWGFRKPLVSPDVTYQFYVSNAGKDRDNLWTTVLDALKAAGVIFDDSIRWYNGVETNRPASIVRARGECVEIVFDPRQS